MRRNQRGFNVIELSATLALLGLLSAIAVPAFNNYTERARKNRAVGEISRISLELYQWRKRFGDGAFPVSLEAAGLGIGPDPWGNAYAYTRIEGSSRIDVRKDSDLNSVNTDFDLYSYGPDGETARVLSAEPGRDDIVRADDGAFIGAAADYP